MGGVVTHIVESGPWAGWISWSDHDFRGFLRVVGPSYARVLDGARAHVVIMTGADHANRLDTLHGGFLAGFADHAYFAALAALGREDLVQGVTIDLTMQYFGAGRVGSNLEAEVEVLRETGRMLFMRLQLMQNGQAIAASTITIRKPSR
ncbi:MAG: PaaI family thioesterase [Sphingobium sp.]